MSFKVQGQGHLSSKLRYGVKDLVTRTTYMKYESPISHGSKCKTKVKVFEKKVKLQGQGH